MRHKLFLFDVLFFHCTELFFKDMRIQGLFIFRDENIQSRPVGNAQKDQANMPEDDSPGIPIIILIGVDPAVFPDEDGNFFDRHDEGSQRDTCNRHSTKHE